MQRQIASIAIAAAAVLGTASSFAADFPAAVGEFSAADSVQTTGAAVTRAEVRESLAAARQAQPTVNGEIAPTGEPVPAALTRAEVRQQGQVAARAGKIAIGNLSM